MSLSDEKLQKIAALHEAAIEAKQMAYIDPYSGYQVFTELFHLERGACCHSSCRHCPYR